MKDTKDPTMKLSPKPKALKCREVTTKHTCARHREANLWRGESLYRMCKSMICIYELTHELTTNGKEKRNVAMLKALTAVGALMTVIDFTLSNARRF